MTKESKKSMLRLTLQVIQTLRDLATTSSLIGHSQKRSACLDSKLVMTPAAKIETSLSDQKEGNWQTLPIMLTGPQLDTLDQ